jgi:MFS family permease
MVMTLAMVITPILSGWLADHSRWGLKILFPYCVAALLLSLLCVVFIPEKKKAVYYGKS